MTNYQPPTVEDEDAENNFPPNISTSPISDSEGVWDLPELDHENKNAPKPLASKQAEIANHSQHSIGESSAEKPKDLRFYHGKRVNEGGTRKAKRQRTREHFARLDRRVKELSSEGLLDESDSDSALAEEQRKKLKLEEEELSQRQQMLAVKEGTGEFQPIPKNTNHLSNKSLSSSLPFHTTSSSSVCYNNPSSRSPR